MKKAVNLGSGETTYDVICEMQNTNGIFKRAIQRGIIPYTILEHKNVYEKYLCYREKWDKMTSYEFVASDCMLSTRQVIRIVKYMSS